MDFGFILYIFLSITLTLSGTYILVKSDRTLGSFLFLIGIVLVLTYYGLRWFSEDSFKFTKFSSNQWPPEVNLCPDFLTHIRRPDTGTKVEYACIDTIGVSQGGIRKYTQDSDLKNVAYLFNLYENEKNVAKRNQLLCQECKEKKVTWEGIYDGVSCLTPSSRDSGAGGGGGAAACPT